MEERYLAIYDYLQEAVNNNEMDEYTANAILEEAYDRYINTYTVEEALDNIEDTIFEDSIDYSLTTENVLDLMEYDILYEKVKETNKKNPQVNTKTASLVAHMKKYYKYYLLAVGLVVGISAAIALAKKKGDKKAAETLETKVLPEAEKIKKEAEKVVNENKEAMKEIQETVKKLDSSPLTPAQKEALSKKLNANIEAHDREVAKHIELTYDSITDVKNMIPSGYKNVTPDKEKINRPGTVSIGPLPNVYLSKLSPEEMDKQLQIVGRNMRIDKVIENYKKKHKNMSESELNKKIIKIVKEYQKEKSTNYDVARNAFTNLDHPKHHEVMKRLNERNQRF